MTDTLNVESRGECLKRASHLGVLAEALRLTTKSLIVPREPSMQHRKNELKQGRIHGHTSCGRVGRGGIARFHTLTRAHRRTDGQTDGQRLL